MKQLRIIVFGIFLFFVLPKKSLAQLDLLDDAFLFYPFDGDCNDYSGNGYHAVGQNLTPDTGYYGLPNTCFLHSGTSSQINRPFLNLEDTIALAGWFYSNSDFQNSNLIYNGNSGTDGYGLFIKKPFTTFGLGNKIVVVQGGLSENIVDTTFSMPLNQWVHLALIIRQNYFELYVNGQFQGSGIRPFNPPSSTFSIGMNPEQLAGGFPAFKGRIDDVVAYKKNLDAQYVARLYNVGFITHNNGIISKKEDVLIFPNPSAGKIRFEGTGISDIPINNSLGQDVSASFKVIYGKFSSALENLNAKAGTHIVQFRMADSKFTKVIQFN